jgi:hypothetical protein
VSRSSRERKIRNEESWKKEEKGRRRSWRN